MTKSMNTGDCSSHPLIEGKMLCNARIIISSEADRATGMHPLGVTF